MFPPSININDLHEKINGDEEVKNCCPDEAKDKSMNERFFP
jgi:hypothetical protein